MIANYHTHTARCYHAFGTDESFAQAAVERGLEILGFSDHSPYIFRGSYYSDYRMEMEKLPGYIQSIENLKKKYQGKLQIHVGVELEYYPKFFPEVLQILRDTPLEYALLGQHFVGNELDGPYSGRPTGSERVLIQYCDQVIEAMNTGVFTYLAHPDLLNFTGDRKLYEQQMRRICREANACGMPVEINLLGIKLGRNYPCRELMAAAAQEGSQVILGCDAHQRSHLLETALEEKALQMLKPYGLVPLERAKVRKI